MINSLTNLINNTIPYAWDNSISMMEFLGKIVTSMNEVISLVNEKLPEDFETKFYLKFREYTREEMDRIVASGEFTEILDSMFVNFTPIKNEVIEARGGEATLGVRVNGIVSQLAEIVTVNATKMIALENGDVTKGIQRSINEAIALNKAHVLWSGVYEINEPLVFERLNTENNTVIVFSGGGRIKKSSTFTGDRLLQFKKGFHDEDNLVFENISFDGVNRTINGIDTFASTVLYNQDGAVVEDSEQTKFVRFYNCTFHRFHRAVRLGSLSYAFYSCLYQDNNYGAFLNISANNNTFFGCQFRRNIIGAYLKQLDPTLGTLGNVFVNCNFESNTNAGLVNENAAFTGVQGGYFENNCYAINNAFPYPPVKCHIHIKDFGSTGRFNANGVFFSPQGMDYEIYGDALVGVSIKACANIRVNADFIMGEIDTSVSNITVRHTVYDSDFIANGIRYTGIKGVISKASNYTETINSRKTVSKDIACVPGANPKITIANLKILNTEQAKINIKCYIKGITGDGNLSAEGYIEHNFMVNKSTRNLSYKSLAVGSSSKVLAFSDSVAGGISENALTGTSEILVEKVTDTTFNISITDMENTSAPDWGYATKYRIQMVIEINGVLHTDMRNRFTEEIIELV